MASTNTVAPDKGYVEQKNTDDGLSSEQLQQLKDVVAKKVDAYDPEAENPEMENLEFKGTEMSTVSELFGRFSDACDKCICWHGLFWGMVMGAALPGFCLVFGELIDEMGEMTSVQDPTKNPMKDNTLYMIYVALGVLVSSACQIASMGIFSESVSYKFKVQYFRSALCKDAAFYDEQNPNEMASKINKEASAVQRGTSDHMSRLVYTLSTFAFGFVVAFWFGWKYSLVLLGGLPFIMCVGGGWGAAMQSGNIEKMKAYAQSAGYAEQALQSIRIVHTYGNEGLEFNNYTKYLDRARQKQREATIKSSFGYASLFAMIFLFYAGSLYVGGFFRWEEIKEGGKDYTGGKIVCIMFCIVFGAMGLGGLGPMTTAIQQGQIACHLGCKVIDHVPVVNVDDKNATQVLSNLKGDIVFSNVNFSYPTRKDMTVLKDFSCTFEAGKTTALVGPSGSGKSTIIQMIERFYQNDSGTITVDGVDIKNLNLRWFRRQMGYVAQEPVLFNTTIKENMKLAKPNASDAEIREALEAANAWTFISKMEKNVDTMVGGSGGSLSGGQKQRVAIARAFLKNPKILLLDEATSALDKVNEKIVQDAIDKYRKSRGDITIIVIAHRLTTIKDADKIVVLVNGTLTEMGNHDELMTNYPNGTYADFCAKQASSEANQASYEPSSEQKAKEDEIVQVIPPVEDDKVTAGGEGSKASSQRRASIKKTKSIVKDGKQVEIDRDPLELQMLEKADKQDEEREEEIKKMLEPLRAQSDWNKVMSYNNPKWLIVVACIAVAAAGFCQPAFGWVFAEMMTILTIPTVNLQFLLEMKNPGAAPDAWKTEVEDKVVELVIYIIIMSVVMFFGYMGKSYIFGYLGENVTLKIRQLLYESILKQNIGWFDFQENQSSVLTSVMASEASLINGAASEALGPYTEAAFALFGGLIIGFIFCWQESLIALGCVPFMIIGNVVAMEFEKKQNLDKEDDDTGSNVMIGDSINNLRTVQSFGYEDLLVEKYKEFLDKGYNISRNKHIKQGLAFGFSQFIVYAIFGALFYFGGLVIENDENVNPLDVFIALFAIFFGASQAGTAMAMGPDMAKATAAATKIFKIIETPSEINAMAMDTDQTKKRIDLSNVKGQIEFKDVWFRYPTRKDDFVLKGLSLKIEPNESVALVGESGCGKSTFVCLLMRFYDPQFGQIFLDGVDIQEYNLHDLRKALSLVMQEPSIFNYSIRDNILYGNLNAKNSQIVDVSDISNCKEFIEKGQLDALDETSKELLREMENAANKRVLIEQMGQETYDKQLEIMKKVKEQDDNKGEFQAIEGDIDTRMARGIANWDDKELTKGFQIQCGIKGSKLSGGQKQRVAIARTLIAQPKVLLLDEATSALDETSQKKVQQAIEAAMQNRTTIVIAHRMSTIEKCSKIFVLEEGKVKEEGAFNDLKAAGGAFAKLAQNKQE